MGKSTRLQGNPNLAEQHVAGTKVEIMQTVAHTPFGAIAYVWLPRQLCAYHYASAREAGARLEELQSDILNVPVAANNVRSIHDHDLLRAIYAAGSEMVSNSVRAAQHLTQDMERVKARRQDDAVSGAQRKPFTLQGRTVEARLKEASKKLNFDAHIESPDYQGLVEINHVRDAIEHPKARNTQQGRANEWDEVPLAWMISDRGVKAFKLFDRWFEAVGDDWVRFCEAHQSPGTVTVVRGIESKLQAKKPPTA